MANTTPSSINSIKKKCSNNGASKSHVSVTRSSLPVSRAFLSGAVAGIVADSFLHPLDTVSLRMKVQCTKSKKNTSIWRTLRTMLREEGFRGYFSGVSTTFICSPICAAVYFGTYETVKESIVPFVSEPYQGAVYFATGAFSEAITSVVSVPSEVIRSRLQLGINPHRASGGAIKYTSNYRNTFHAACSILRSEGMKGLYSGYSACLSIDMAHSAFSLLIYESLKKHYGQHIIATEGQSRDFRTFESLICGAIAGGSAAFITNPLDIVTVRLMTQGKHQRYFGMQHCFMETLRQEKIRGLWKGSLARTLAIMPSAGICFGVYETIKRVFFHSQMEDLDANDFL
jgi:hypothetical protein